MFGRSRRSPRAPIATTFVSSNDVQRWRSCVSATAGGQSSFNTPGAAPPVPISVRLAGAHRPGTTSLRSVVAVAHNVDDVAIWVPHEEPPNTPRFERQRVDDLIATALRLGVGVFDAIADMH